AVEPDRARGAAVLRPEQARGADPRAQAFGHMEGLMSAPDEFVHEINAQKVSATLLGKVMHLWASLSSNEWNDFDRKLERVVDLVGKEHCGDGAPMLAMAVALRLMALDALVLDPEFRGWLITGHSPDGITYIHGDLLQI